MSACVHSVDDTGKCVRCGEQVLVEGPTAIVEPTGRLSLILLAGAEHSKRNAEKIRAWAREEKRAAFAELVRDWQRRAFLTKADADGLISGG